MITEYIRYRIDPDHVGNFEAAYAAATVRLAGSSHCVDFELSRCHEEPGRFILRIRWDSLDAHLQGFRQSADFRDFFTHIRPYVDDIEEMQHYVATGISGDGAGSPKPPTLYEWAGGVNALRRMIDAFYDRVEQIDLFTPLFPNGVSEEHRDSVTAWWAEVFGGPPRYTNDLGGYENMLHHHRNCSVALAHFRGRR